MELELIGEKETRIKCPLKNYTKMKTLINSYLHLYGGKEEKKNSRYIYFIVHADLLNRKRSGEP